MASFTNSAVAKTVNARHLLGMAVMLRLLTVCLVALALWCAGSVRHGAQAAAPVYGPAEMTEMAMTHQAAAAGHQPGDAHSPGDHVHAVCATMAGHCLYTLSPAQAPLASPVAAAVQWGMAAASPPDGVSPEALIPPPRV